MSVGKDEREFADILLAILRPLSWAYIVVASESQSFDLRKIEVELWLLRILQELLLTLNPNP